jgi:hypothetical protein
MSLERADITNAHISDGMEEAQKSMTSILSSETEMRRQSISKSTAIEIDPNQKFIKDAFTKFEKDYNSPSRASQEQPTRQQLPKIKKHNKKGLAIKRNSTNIKLQIVTDTLPKIGISSY